MTDQKYVQKYYPYSYTEGTINWAKVWSDGKENILLGSGKTFKEAWLNARKKIESLPEDQKPKIK